jgi:aldehyde reductase
LFITSKLWNQFHEPKEVRGAIEFSLKQLNLKYLDLYLIHWPIGYQKTKDLFPKGADGKVLYSIVDLRDVWKAMEELVDAGLTKSIGVSNFNIKQVDYILDNARIKPVTNQIEVHPCILNKELIAHCRSKNVAITAYSPLGSPGFTDGRSGRTVMKEPKLLAIAEKYNKSPAQILIRYQVQIGNVVIPKSVTKERIISNMDVFNFTLTDEDIKDIEGFGYTERICKMSQDKDHPGYPWK